MIGVRFSTGKRSSLSIRTGAIHIDHKTVLIWVSIALLVLAGACSGSGDSGASINPENEISDVVEPTPQPRITVGTDSTTVEIHLSRETPGGQSGTAVIETVGEITTVTVAVEPPSNEVQPMHIHAGTCDDVGPILFSLENLVRGQSVTELDADLKTLHDQPGLINVHASFTDFSTSTACASLPELFGS